MNSKLLVVIAVVLLLLGGAYLLSQNNTDRNTQDSINSTSELNQESRDITPSSTESSPSGETVEGSVKDFTVNGDNFRFDVKEMRVKKGDTVQVTFNNTGGSHDFVIDEFNVATKVLPNGGSETVEFVADKTGEFEYYCSVGTHRQLGMKGTLIVE